MANPAEGTLNQPASLHWCMSNGRISPTGVAASTELPDCHVSDVQGFPRSALRDFTRRLTFVPAGHGLSRPLKLRTLTHTTYFYIDTRGPPTNPALRFGQDRIQTALITISGRAFFANTTSSRPALSCSINSALTPICTSSFTPGCSLAKRPSAECHSACNIDPLSRGIGVQN
jgi:hypothetical protein